MPAATYPLQIEQGATFRRTLTWGPAAAPAAALSGPFTVEPTMGTPYDLTRCTARMQIRRTRNDVVLVELTDDNGGLLLGGTAGTVEIVITATQTDLLNVTKAVYDLEIVFPSGDVVRLLEGAVAVDLNVTRTDP